MVCVRVYVCKRLFHLLIFVISRLSAGDEKLGGRLSLQHLRNEIQTTTYERGSCVLQTHLTVAVCACCLVARSAVTHLLWVRAEESITVLGVTGNCGKVYVGGSFFRSCDYLGNMCVVFIAGPGWDSLGLVVITTITLG